MEEHDGGVARALARSRDDPAYRRVLEGLTGIPTTTGNRIRVLRNGDEIFPAMLDAVHRARDTIDFLTYIYWQGGIARRFAEALADRARDGVRVRVLLDAFGTRHMERHLIDGLRRAGVSVERFRPLSGRVWRWNLRTHRRVLVCDEEVAFTGGVGIAEQWEGDADTPEHWRDTHFEVEGPAVDGIHAAFRCNWLELDHPVLTGADRFTERTGADGSSVQVIRAASQPGWNDVALAVAGMLVLARKRVRVTSAYFRPPPFFRVLLGAAVERGVAVDVLVPEAHVRPVHARWAAEYHYEELLQRGVRLWLYQPTMHHAKILTVDGAVALVGTTNFDARSLAVNEQVGMIVHDAHVTAVLDRHFDDDRAASRQLDSSTWRQRDWRQRGREVAAHLATYGIRGGGASRRDRRRGRSPRRGASATG